MACTWLGEISSCSCLMLCLALPGSCLARFTNLFRPLCTCIGMEITDKASNRLRERALVAGGDKDVDRLTKFRVHLFNNAETYLIWKTRFNRASLCRLFYPTETPES